MSNVCENTQLRQLQGQLGGKFFLLTIVRRLRRWQLGDLCVARSHNNCIMVGVMEINHLVSSCVQITHKYITIMLHCSLLSLSIQKLIFTLKRFSDKFQISQRTEESIDVSTISGQGPGGPGKTASLPLGGRNYREERRGGGGWRRRVTSNNKLPKLLTALLTLTNCSFKI